MEEIISENSEGIALAALADTEEQTIGSSDNADRNDEGRDSRHTADVEIDVEGLLSEELSELKNAFPELSSAKDITEIKNPLRYAALRDLGLTPTEAYLAARGPVSRANNRAHLSASVPRVTGRGASMPREELARAREIFYGMSDSEIQRLWQKVTK